MKINELKALGLVTVSLAAFLFPTTLSKPVEAGVATITVKYASKDLNVAQVASPAFKDGIPVSAQDYVRQAAKKYGWDTGAQWDALHTLVNNESGFRVTANNPSSAHGMFQFLNSTWASYGCVKTDDPAEQSRCGLLYVSRRYQNPVHALAVWYSHCPSKQKCWY